MNFEGYEGSNFAKLLSYNNALADLNNIESKNKTEYSQYIELIRCLLDFDYLFIIAAKKDFGKMANSFDNSGCPALFQDKNGDSFLLVFTTIVAYRRYLFLNRNSENDFPCLLLEKYIEDSHQPDSDQFYNVFQTAQALDCQFIRVYKGNMESIDIPIKVILKYGYPKSTKQTFLERKDKYRGENGKMCFNRLRTAEDVKECNRYCFSTLQTMSYSMAFEIIHAAIVSGMEWFQLGYIFIAGSSTTWVTSDEELKKQGIDPAKDGFIYNTCLTEEQGGVAIAGFSKVLKRVIQIEVYNQTRTALLYIFNEDAEECKNKEGKYVHDGLIRLYEQYMVSLEIGAHMNKGIRQALNTYKEYIQEKKGIKEMSQKTADKIHRGYFESFNFVPDLDTPKEQIQPPLKEKKDIKKKSQKTADKPCGEYSEPFSSASEIDTPKEQTQPLFTMNYPDEAFLSISEDEMKKATIVMNNVIDVNLSEKDKNICIARLYSGKECTNDGHNEIGSSEYGETVDKFRYDNKISKHRCLLSRKEFPGSCKREGNSVPCLHGTKCIRLIAVYMFHLKNTDKYKYRDLMLRWENTHKKKVIDCPCCKEVFIFDTRYIPDGSTYEAICPKCGMMHKMKKIVFNKKT